MSYYADDLLIGGSLALYGEYSELEIDFLRQIIKPGWTVIDVGANIGCLTLAFAEMVGDGGRVIGFEAQPESFELLARNVGNRSNVDVQHVAVGISSGSIKAPPLASLPHKNYGGVALGGDFGDSVLERPLDMLVDRVSLIKIDAEGMECEILRGARNTIERCRPIIYAEVDHVDGVEQLLIEYGYKVFSHKPPMYNPRNFHKAPLIDLFNYVSVNVLAIPAEQVPAYAAVVDQLRPSASALSRSRLGATAWAGFARCGGIGDNLIAAAVAKPLKDLGYMVEVISQRPNHVLFENNPHVDKLVVYEAADWPKDPQQWNRWFDLHSKGFAKFANLSHSVEARHAAFTDSTWFWWPQHYRRKFFAGSYLETACDLLDVPYTFDRLFWPTEAEIEDALATKLKIGVGPIIGWCCNGTRIDKIYPQAPQAIGRLIKELDAQVVLIGRGPGTADFTLATQAMEMVEAQNGSRTGLHRIGSGYPPDDSWPLRRVLATAQALDLVIGPDTGPMWAVALEPTPKILLHGHASVENIARHWVNTASLTAGASVDCWPCHRLHNDESTCRLNKWGNGAACISDISVDAVIAAARQLLGDTHA